MAALDGRGATTLAVDGGSRGSRFGDSLVQRTCAEEARERLSNGAGCYSCLGTLILYKIPLTETPLFDS